MVKDIIQDLLFDLIRTREKLGSTDNIYFYLIKALRRRILCSTNDARVQNYNDISKMPFANIIFSVEDEFIQKEELTVKEKMVRKALNNLSPKQREIIYYRFTCAFEYDQICELMSIKYDTARKMVFRAMRSLREELADSFILLFYLHGHSSNNCEK